MFAIFVPVSKAASKRFATVMQKLKEQLKELDEELHKTPATLEELKQVLNVINTIRRTSMNMELRYVDLEERFRQVGHTAILSRASAAHILRVCYPNIEAFCWHIEGMLLVGRHQKCHVCQAEMETCSMSVVTASDTLHY